jgi:WD40 repeat protein/DNA-binding SARP family transcriptional activator
VQLEVSTLGQFQVQVDGDAVRFATDHGRALLAYLAVEADRPHARSYLAYLLWPDHAESQALNNLRQTLIRTRQALGMGDDLANVLQITPKTLQFYSAGAWLDVRHFRQLVAQCKIHNHRSLEQCPECIERLEQAASLYKGEFLQGLTLRHSQPFSEWAVFVREELHHQMLSILGTLANHYEQVADYTLARSYVAHQLSLEPWHEEAHCQMMRVLAKGGQRSAAIHQYEICKRVLQEELGIAPSSETTLLYERIKADAFERDTSDVDTRAPSIALSGRALWGDLPVVNRLYGRETELAELEKWLTHDNVQLITILGMGGIGKTTLTTAAIENVTGNYDLVLWRSLHNAPTPDEILSDWLALMAGDGLAELPTGFEAQLQLLLHHLRQKRYLLILDNLESILDAEQAGQPLPEYEGYLLICQQVVATQHQSCLVLTSREQLQGVSLPEEETPRARLLQLQGLEINAAQSLLMARGLNLTASQVATMVNRYSGNPMALKLVAETIREVFAGDATAFLSSETMIFDDIRAVLEQQFDRLPPLEQEILLWLAIEREPISLETLSENLSPPRPTPEVVQAVRSLQRRSLLQRATLPEARAVAVAGHGVGELSATLWTDTRFATANVVMEYLVDRLQQTICREIGQGTPDWLHTYCLMQAHAKAYISQSQARLILQPIASQLEARFGRNGVARKVKQLLDVLRTEAFPPRTYAVGNLLNLLLLMEVDISDLDLSGLAVWDVDLRQANLNGINFSDADLSRSRFADAFGVVYAVAVSPDGSTLAAGTSDGEIRLWNINSGQLLHIYPGHKGPVRSVAFHPNGKILASSGEDHTVRLWQIGVAEDASAGENINTSGEGSPLTGIWQGHMGRVMSVAFHPSGNMLASTSVDGTLRLWDVVSKEPRAVLGQLDQPLWALAFSPNGEILASSDASGVVTLWDSHTGEQRATLTGHAQLVTSLDFDPSGRWLAASGYGRILYVWDVATGETVTSFEAANNFIMCIAFSPNGALLATAGDDRTIRIWDTTNWTVAQQLHGHNDSVCALAFMPDGQTLVSGGADHSVYLWHLPSARIHRAFSGYSQRVNALSYHPSGKLLASGHYDRSVRLWDLETRTVRRTLRGHSLSVNDVTFSKDGKLLASASMDKSIQVWTLPELKPGIDKVTEIRRRYHLRGHQRGVTSLDFLPNGRILFSGSEDLTAGIWEMENGLPISFQMVGEVPVDVIQSNAAGDLIAMSSDQHIWLWRYPGMELYKELRGHARFIWSLAFSPDDRFLASGGSDGAVGLWNVTDPANTYLHARLRGHSERVFAVAFSPDGAHLASGSADNTICLWDAQTHQLRFSLKAHSHWVWALAFSPDGRTLASGSFDQTIRLWDVQSGELIDELHPPGPYAGMNISDATGLSEAERTILKQLGAIDG